MVKGQLFKIHLVQLIAGKDQNVVKIVVDHVVHRLTYRICRSLKPVGRIGCLFSGQNIYKAMRKHVEGVGIFDVLIE